MNLAKRTSCLLLACVCLVTFGCEKKAMEGPLETRLIAEQSAAGGAAPPRSRQNDSLAYEHTVAVELSKEILPTRLRDLEKACNDDEASGCTILEVSAHSNESVPSGSIRMRLAPGGVDAIVALASKDGKITYRTTQAEDLAEPVADTERHLALMTVHRDRLTEFMKSKDLKVDQLIEVSKELASVQTQIDSLSTQRANLRRRIDTELLTINLSIPSVDYDKEQSPVSDALKSFGSTLREATGMVIQFIAVLLPWLVVVLPSLILLRMFWRWITRWLVNRERRAGQT